MRKGLREEFPPEQIGKLPRTDKRPELDFVGHAAVTDRLNAVAPDWSYVIDDEKRYVAQQTNQRTGEIREVVTVWLRGTMTVGGISRVEYGDGDDFKEAIGNFIRRAAMRFGVALDLWSRQELAGVRALGNEAADTATGTGRDHAPGSPSPQSSAAVEPADASTETLAYGEGVGGSEEVEREGEAPETKPSSPSRRYVCPVNKGKHKASPEQAAKLPHLKAGYIVCACGVAKPEKEKSEDWA